LSLATFSIALATLFVLDLTSLVESGDGVNIFLFAFGLRSWLELLGFLRQFIAALQVSLGWAGPEQMEQCQRLPPVGHGALRIFSRDLFESTFCLLVFKRMQHGDR
jgi:hypothetical protein